MQSRCTLLLTAMLCAASAAQAAPGGKLHTLPIGKYVCSVPGDASGQAWQELPGKDFTIGNASTYHTEQGSGTYLLTGKSVRFTRGPMNGMQFTRTGTGTLRWVDENGEPGRVRCVRTSASR